MQMYKSARSCEVALATDGLVNKFTSQIKESKLKADFDSL